MAFAVFAYLIVKVTRRSWRELSADRVTVAPLMRAKHLDFITGSFHR